MLFRPLTVVQLLPALDGGGVERGTLEVAHALVRAGHRSVVVSAGGRLVGPLVRGGAEHVQLPVGSKSPRALAAVAGLRSLCLRRRVDVLHARSRVPAWVTTLARRGLAAERRPYFVTTMHGLHRVSRYSEVMTHGQSVIAVSQTVREHILENYPRCPAERITVIPRGVDPAAFPRGHRPTAKWRSEFLDAHPNARDRKLVALPGRLTRLKGHHDFLDVISRLPDDVHGLIVGGEDPKRAAYAAEVRQAIVDRGLSDRVTLTGHRSDIREVVAACDAILSLSTSPESFGRTVLETLSLGKPVVGYDHGGVGEVLADLFPEGAVLLGDTAAVAAKVLDLLDRDARPAPFRSYQLDSMCSAVVGIYERVSGIGTTPALLRAA